jgi:glycosyltransferase involved in cell wall biosynthesis
VVAPRVGGVPDCVVDERTGIIVDPDDHAGFAAACVRLLEDEDLRTQMGIDARNYMTEFFSIEAMAARYLAVLSRTTDGGSKT